LIWLAFIPFYIGGDDCGISIALRLYRVDPISTQTLKHKSNMVTFDLRETLIPFSLLEITNVFRGMKPGEEMEIFAGVTHIDAAILKDVLLILPQTDYDLISRENRVGDNPVTRLRLRKKTITNASTEGRSS
jgi:hypothetical protein